MLRKIKLYGQLAKFVGHKVLEADVATAAEAVRFLVANWPELEQHMAKQYYRVHTGGEDLLLEQINNPASQEIKIVPVVAGAGSVGRIILGVALVALAFVSFGSSFLGGAFAGLGAKGAIGSALFFNVGAALVLSGVAELISPTPRSEKDDPRKSFSFSGIQNTSRVGLPVPVVYGEVLVGSVVVSAGVDIVQVAV